MPEYEVFRHMIRMTVWLDIACVIAWLGFGVAMIGLGVLIYRDYTYDKHR